MKYREMFIILGLKMPSIGILGNMWKLCVHKVNKLKSKIQKWKKQNKIKQNKNWNMHLFSLPDPSRTQKLLVNILISTAVYLF